MARIEREKCVITMIEYVRVRNNEIKLFGNILVVCSIYHQMDIRRFIRANCRSGLTLWRRNFFLILAHLYVNCE
jgi:uncharacterized membrane protein YecN with MAPEG domain